MAHQDTSVYMSAKQALSGDTETGYPKLTQKLSNWDRASGLTRKEASPEEKIDRMHKLLEKEQEDLLLNLKLEQNQVNRLEMKNKLETQNTAEGHQLSEPKLCLGCKQQEVSDGDVFCSDTCYSSYTVTGKTKKLPGLSVFEELDKSFSKENYL